MRGKKIWGTLDPFYETGGVMGRSVANSGFLDALLKLDPFDEYHFFLKDRNEAAGLEQALANTHPALLKKVLVKTRLELPQALENGGYHCFHLSDCINHPPHLARLRNMLSPEIFPVTSLTHSLSYSRYGRDFLAHLWPGCTPRDVITATSRAGKNAVQGFFDYLRENYHLDPDEFPQPGIEIIPLGIDPEELSPLPPEQKASLREKMGYEPSQSVILIFARLSHYSKMDILPVFNVLQRLISAGVEPKSLCLTLAGASQAGDDLPGRFGGLARNLGLDLRIHPNVDNTFKRDLFAAADIFLSPVDNPQETFGLSLLEAGLAGLPVLASDYDGYRDIVVHGQTGFLTQTTGPADTTELDALAGLWFDNQSHLFMAQQTAVNVSDLTARLLELIRDPELGQTMGRAARSRILNEFTWDKAVERCLRLWDDLWSRSVNNKPLRQTPHPLHPPYGRVFSAYPTARLDPETSLRRTRSGEMVYQKKEFYLIYAGLEGGLEPDAVRTLLFLARTPAPTAKLIRKLIQHNPMSKEKARLHILWSLKHDLLEQE